MEKRKSPASGSGFPPPPGHYSHFPAASNSVNSLPITSLCSPSFRPATSTGFSHLGPTISSDHYSFSLDISQMPDLPVRNLGHRRAYSEIPGLLPENVYYDTDIAGGIVDAPSLSDETEEDLFSMYIDMEKFSSSCATLGFDIGESSGTANVAPHPSDNVSTDPAEKPWLRHQHSQSMDGLISIEPEWLLSGKEGASASDTKKALSQARLAELSVTDPKRARRVWANRQSAARSKERKTRYILELERKVQSLQTEATKLSAQVTILQSDTNGMNAENNELKLRLQTINQQVYLQDALNEALKNKVQHLKVATGQASANPSMDNCASPFLGANQLFNPQNNAMHAHLAAKQMQQLQLQSHQQSVPNFQHPLCYQFTGMNFESGSLAPKNPIEDPASETSEPSKDPRGTGASNGNYYNSKE